MLMTIVAGRKGAAPMDIPVSQTLTAPAREGWETVLDRYWIWIAVLLLLIAIAYGPFFLTYEPSFTSPPFRGI
jgi:cytochrome c oxidase subunit 1